MLCEIPHFAGGHTRRGGGGGGGGEFELTTKDLQNQMKWRRKGAIFCANYNCYETFKNETNSFTKLSQNKSVALNEPIKIKFYKI
jgi:hypothetical protein